MGLQLTDRQRKIYKEYVLDPLVKEVSRTLEIGCDSMTKKDKLKHLTFSPAFEQEYNAIMKEYDEINVEENTKLSDTLYKQREKFTELGFDSHQVSPNEFEYILNETEKILFAEKAKNDEFLRRISEWNERADNFINLCEAV